MRWREASYRGQGGRVDIRPLDLSDPADLDAWVAIRNAGEALDVPEQRPVTAAREAGRFRHGWDGEPAHPFLAEVAGVAVAGGSVSVSDIDNLHQAWLEVRVHPEHRRRGHGTAVLTHLMEEARRRGRTVAGADCFAGTPGEHFAVHHGFEARSVVIQRRHHLREVDADALQALRVEGAAHARDYDLQRWAVPTPHERLDALAELASVINDAPLDDLDHEPEIYTAQRMRDYEAATAGKGQRMHRIVAVHRPTGALAGQTVVVVDDGPDAIAHQHDTAVARAHRGHRLGLLLKVAMVQHLARAEPTVDVVETWNAASNHHMVAVNERLGYRVTARELHLQRRL